MEAAGLERGAGEEGARIVDEGSLRSRRGVFEDRDHAGRLLAEKLQGKVKEDMVVLAIPSGGVPVGCAVAEALKAPLDLMVVRKLQVPWSPEAGFGAVTVDGTVVLNEPLVAGLGLTQEEISRCAAQTVEIIKERRRKFRGDRPFPDLKGKTVILVDDGLASGYTMLAAVISVRKREPRRVIVAVPTAPPASIQLIAPHVDEVVCLNIRDELYFAVADAYQRWYDLGDEEVVECLNKSKRLKGP